jgi:hypothetical protein
METMSFRLGIKHYIYSNNSISKRNDRCKEIVTLEILHIKNEINKKNDN